MPVKDPLGVARCAMCSNAFAYDADERASGILFSEGDGFICRWCAERLDIVGLAEIAERLDVQRATVDQWRQRRLLPEPAWTVGGRPAWPWQVIDRWAAAHGRQPRTGHQ